MGSNDRRGAKKDRNQNLSSRKPELGYYLIVTDTEETEEQYFKGLKETIPAPMQDRLVIKVEKAQTVDLIKKCKELVSKEAQYRIPWIVFDRDRVIDFDNIIEEAGKVDSNKNRKLHFQFLKGDRHQFTIFPMSLLPLWGAERPACYCFIWCLR